MRQLWSGFFMLILFMLVVSAPAATIDKNKYYYIKSVISGDNDKGYWDLPGGGRKYKQGDDLHLWAIDRGDDRKYIITQSEDGWFYISPVNALSGGVIRGTVDVAGATVQNGSRLYVMDIKFTDNYSQLFKFTDTGDGKFRIYVNKGGGKKILCAEGGADKNGTPVIALDENDNPACHWQFIEAGRVERTFTSGL